MVEAEPTAHRAWEMSFTWFRLHRENLRRILAGFDLTPMQMHALRALTPGRARPISEVANLIYCDPANATSVVTALTRRGLLERVQDPLDRRVRAVTLTDEGMQVRARLIAALSSPPDAFAALGPDRQEALTELLAALPPASEDPQAAGPGSTAGS
jgi:DNA-binding MarR family transcriptional regulator